MHLKGLVNDHANHENHTNWDFPEIKILFLMKRFKDKFYFILEYLLPSNNKICQNSSSNDTNFLKFLYQRNLFSLVPILYQNTISIDKISFTTKICKINLVFQYTYSYYQ